MLALCLRTERLWCIFYSDQNRGHRSLKKKKNFPHFCKSFCLLLINHSLSVGADGRSPPRTTTSTLWYDMLKLPWSFSKWGHLVMWLWLYVLCICLLTQLRTRPGSHGQLLRPGAVFFTTSVRTISLINPTLGLLCDKNKCHVMVLRRARAANSPAPIDCRVGRWSSWTRCDSCTDKTVKTFFSVK